MTLPMKIIFTFIIMFPLLDIICQDVYTMLKQTVLYCTGINATSVIYIIYIELIMLLM